VAEVEAPWETIRSTSLLAAVGLGGAWHCSVEKLAEMGLQREVSTVTVVLALKPVPVIVRTLPPP